jgi:NAD(P)-dependent dehydrogenase (short-subunit alcohol dehydrogenase family)
MPKSMTVYAATKAALSHLGEGLQYELLGKPIKVTVLHCGYIASEMNEKVQQQVRFMVSTEDGVRSMVDAIQKEKAHAYVPPLPWTALAPVMKHPHSPCSSASSDPPLIVNFWPVYRDQTSVGPANSTGHRVVADPRSRWPRVC